MSSDPESQLPGFGSLLLRTAFVVVPLHLFAVVASVLCLVQLLPDLSASAPGLRERLLIDALTLLEQPARWLLDSVSAFHPALDPTMLIEWLLAMVCNGGLWSLALVCLQMCIVRPILRRRAKARRLEALRRPQDMAAPWSH